MQEFVEYNRALIKTKPWLFWPDIFLVSMKWIIHQADLLSSDAHKHHCCLENNLCFFLPTKTLKVNRLAWNITVFFKCSGRQPGFTSQASVTVMVKAVELSHVPDPDGPEDLVTGSFLDCATQMCKVKGTCKTRPTGLARELQGRRKEEVRLGRACQIHFILIAKYKREIMIRCSHRAPSPWRGRRCTCRVQLNVHSHFDSSH